MATALKPGENTEDEQLSHAHNPVDDEFRQIVDNNFSTKEQQRLAEEGREGFRDNVEKSKDNANLDDVRKGENSSAVGGDKKRDVAAQEQKPWETDVNSNKSEGGKQGGSGNRFKKAGAIAGFGIAGILGGGILLFSMITSMLVDWKENSTEASMKRVTTRSAQRAAKSMEKKYFREPQDCKGIRCRFKNGVNDREIRTLQRGGHTVEVGEQTVNGKKKKYIKSITLFGTDTKLDKDNYKTEFKKSLAVRQFTAHALRVNGSFSRTTKMVIKMNRGLDMSRKNQLADSEKENKEGFKKKIRQYLFGDYKGKFDVQGNEKRDENGKVINGDQVAGDNGLSEDINQAAEEERKRLLDDPNASPNWKPDLKLAANVAKGAAGGSVRFSRLTGAAEAGCAGYRILRAVDYGAKFYRMLALVRYAGMFMTFADAIKTGEVTGSQVNFMASLLLLPDSQGRNFFDSPGMQYILYKIRPSRSSIAQYTNGTTFAGVIGDARRFVDKATFGDADGTCKVVENVFFQIGSTLVSAVAAFFTGGTSLGFSMAVGAAGGVMLAVLESYAVPILVQYAAGTVVTGDENGYEIGTAVAAGMGALSMHMSRSQGMRPMLKSEVAADTTETDRLYNDFFPENKPSLTDKIRTNVAALGLKTMTSTALFKPVSLFASAGTNYSSSSVFATDAVVPSDDCEDEDYNDAKIATDTFCNPIYTESTENIEDPKYDPEAVIEYMIKGQYVDEETGEPRTDTDNGEEYEEYRSVCMDGIVPLVNYDVDIDGETINPMELCNRLDEETTMWRFYRWDENINEDPSEVHKLISQSGEGSSGGGTNTGGKLAVWPVKGGGTISSCWNITDTSYRQHHGLDIAAPIGTDIVAPADGTVVFSGPSGGYGNYIAIKHGEVATGYGHNSQNLVKVGDKVRQGQVIGKVGSEGQSTGPHLHFNVMPPNGIFTTMSTSTSFNPLKYVTKPASVGDPNGCVAKAK